MVGVAWESNDHSNRCEVMVISVAVVGVNLSDKVCLPSIKIGLLVMLYIDIVLFLIEASVGGGQLVDLLASTSMSWSGRLVLTNRWSPGSIIFLVLIDMSRFCGFVCCCVAVIVVLVVCCE